MKAKEEILKALKEEMTHKVKRHDCLICHDCLVANFYLTSVGEKIYPNFDGRIPCFYRFCAILEYYFGIATEETQKIYLKYGRYTDLFYSCEIFKSRKDFWQEVYTLCLKRINFNKI